MYMLDCPTLPIWWNTCTVKHIPAPETHTSINITYVIGLGLWRLNWTKIYKRGIGQHKILSDLHLITQCNSHPKISYSWKEDWFVLWVVLPMLEIKKYQELFLILTYNQETFNIYDGPTIFMTIPSNKPKTVKTIQLVKVSLY